MVRTSLENAGADEIRSLSWRMGTFSLLADCRTRVAICGNGGRRRCAHGTRPSWFLGISASIVLMSHPRGSGLNSMPIRPSDYDQDRQVGGVTAARSD